MSVVVEPPTRRAASAPPRGPARAAHRDPRPARSRPARASSRSRWRTSSGSAADRSARRSASWSRRDSSSSSRIAGRWSSASPRPRSRRSTGSAPCSRDGRSRSACRVVTDDDLDALAETVERMIEASEAGDVARRDRTRPAVPRPGRRAVRVPVPAPAVDEHRRRRPLARRRTAARAELADPVDGPRVADRAVDRTPRARRGAAQPAAGGRRPGRPRAHVNRGLERLRADARR